MTMNYYVGYVPKLIPAVVMSIFYGIVLVTHATFAFIQKDRFFSFSMIIGCFLELIGFVGRWRGHSHPTNLAAYASSSFGLTVAPILFMAAIYNAFAESIPPLGSRYSLLDPKWYRRIFIVSDVISFVVQSAGGAITTTQANNGSDSRVGTIIMTAALAFQVASMSIFLGLVFCFFYRIRVAQLGQRYEVDAPTREQYLEYASLRKSSFFRAHIVAFIAATVFILIRCVYRVVEMSAGFDGPTTNSEWWFMGLDMIPVGVAVALITIVNPGIALRKGRFAKPQEFKLEPA